MSPATHGNAPDATDASALSPLRVPIFRSVWVASLFSNFGGLIQSVGASWMMLSIAHSRDMVALVQTSVALPLTLLSLVAGAMADSIDRRKVMLSAQLFMLTMSLGLAICTWTGVMTPWLLLTFTFLIGCGGAFHNPAWQASVSEMVPRTQLAAAVTLNSMGVNIARSVGPAIGGIIVAAAGPAVAFGFNSVTYTGLLSVLARWRPAPVARLLPRESLGLAMFAGLRYVRMSPAILKVLARSALYGFGSSAVVALMPLVAKELLKGGAFTYGLLSGAFGIGAVAGAMSIAWVRQRLTTEIIVRIASIGSAVAAAIVGLSTHIALTLPVLAVAGAMWVVALSTFNVSVQLSTPRWVLARALSVYQTATFGGMAAGSWILGVLADRSGVTLGLLTAGAVTLLNAALGFRVPLSQTEQLNLDPLRSWQAPETALPVDSRTGPVVVTIEYRIREQDIVEFLNIMSERRRIRRRDGARNWTLLRDLADPEVWVERYKTPTWLDYIRHSNRMTQDDATVLNRLRALHAGPNLPNLRRLIERETGSLPSSPSTITETFTDTT